MVRPTDKELEERQKFLELLKKCRDSPSVFSKVFLGHEVFPHNQPYVNSKEPFIVYRSGRQAGKTQTTAAKTIHFAFFAPQMHDQVKKECIILVVAPTQNQAGIMFDRIRGLVEGSDFLRKYIVRSTQTELWVRFLDGTGITKIITRAVGETGMSIRGYSPHLIIADEASFIKRDIFIALMPSGLATHAYVWLTSTPFSKTSYFYECSIDSRPKESKGIWFEYHVKSTDNPLVMSNPIYLQQVKNMTREQYMQEVDGEFLDIGNALIPRNLLVDSLGDFRLPNNVRYYLGVDVARLGTDETVYMLVAIDENEKVYVVHMEDESQSNIIDVGGRIRDLCRDYPIEAVYVESNGLGGGVIDTGAKFGCPMRSIEASPTNKADRYTKVRMVFENHNIKIREKGKLIDQLALMTREYTENGIMKVKTEGKHDDYPDALSLALSALQSDGTWHVLDMGKSLKKALFG